MAHGPRAEWNYSPMNLSNINVKQELVKAVITFLIYLGTEFVATASLANPITDWSVWVVGVILAGSRIVVSQLVGVLMTTKV